MLETTLDEVLCRDKKTSEIFLGVFARDELPKDPVYPSCFVFNTAPRCMSGEHWLCVFYDKNGCCDFFDSYGMPPENFNMKSYLNATSNSWKYNKQRIQGESMYCGHYCILFLLFRVRSKSINFFLAFSKNFTKNDKKLKELMADF